MHATVLNILAENLAQERIVNFGLDWLRC